MLRRCESSTARWGMILVLGLGFFAASCSEPGRHTSQVNQPQQQVSFGLSRTFLSPNRAANGYFGAAIASFGNAVVITQPGADAAHVFESSTGELRCTIPNPNPGRLPVNDDFGGVVATVPNASGGMNVLVGAPQESELVAGKEVHGAAYLFDGMTCDLLHAFVSPLPQPYGKFGHTVAAIGSNVLISEPFNDLPGPGAGLVFLFDGTTGQHLQTFPNPKPDFVQSQDLFGYSLAAIGDQVLVGALFEDTRATDDGAVYRFDASTAQLLQTFLDPEPSQSFTNFFGISVVALGSDVLVGAYGKDTVSWLNGVVYLFDGSTGAVRRTFASPNPGPDDWFGREVGLLGSNVLISAVNDDSAGTDAGAVYLFDPTTGDRLFTFLNPNPYWSFLPDDFGSSFAAVGDDVIIGSRLEDQAATDAGAAYLFRRLSNLHVAVAAEKSIYTLGSLVRITATVTDGTDPLPGAVVRVEVLTASGRVLVFYGTTDESGVAAFQVRPSKKDGVGTYRVAAYASKSGFASGRGSTTFEVTSR